MEEEVPVIPGTAVIPDPLIAEVKGATVAVPAVRDAVEGVIKDLQFYDLEGPLDAFFCTCGSITKKSGGSGNCEMVSRYFSFSKRLNCPR